LFKKKVELCIVLQSQRIYWIYWFKECNVF